MSKIDGITGVDNRQLFDEIRRAVEERYPISVGKIYIPVVVIYEFMREHKDEYPVINRARDQHMKRIITQTFSSEFGWKRYGNTLCMRVRSAVFNRSGQ